MLKRSVFIGMKLTDGKSTLKVVDMDLVLKTVTISPFVGNERMSASRVVPLVEIRNFYYESAISKADCSDVILYLLNAYAGNFGKRLVMQKQKRYLLDKFVEAYIQGVEDSFYRVFNLDGDRSIFAFMHTTLDTMDWVDFYKNSSKRKRQSM